MRLTAVVRLMIEEMSQGRCKRLRYRLRIGDWRVGEAAGQFVAIQRADPSNDASVLRLPLRPKRFEVVVQDDIEARIGRALAGETAQPDAVGDKEVVQCAEHGSEERTAIGAAVFIRKLLSARV